MRKSILYILIATLLLVIGFEEVRIFFLNDAVAVRDTDIHNCELDLQSGTSPKNYKKTKATIY